ncbi:hypothetical protein RB599_010106 [Gaeumannomyces hyphopodioides]
MAISDRIPGLEVTVEVDGERAVEHHDDAAYDEPCAVAFDSPAGVRVVKYIEAKSGAPFSLRIKRAANFDLRGDQIGWFVAVDGGPYWGLQEITLRTPRIGAVYLSEISGYPEGDAVSGFIKKRWKFGDLDIESADTRSTAEVMAKQTSLAKSLGVITVKVHHMLRPTEVRSQRAFHDDKNTGPINEKALKGRALSLRTTTDAEPGSRSGQSRQYEFNYLDPQRRPFAVFEFRYRTREDLIKEAILRAPPSPAKKIDDNQLVILIDDEDNDSASRTVKGEAKVVKEEKKPAAGIKREAGEASQAPPSRRIKQSRRPDGKFLVDLTDD